MTKSEALKQVAQFCANIQALAPDHGGIGAVEQQAHVSPGYLSRKKYDRGMSLGIAILFADAVGVKIDDILRTDLSRKKRIEQLEKELEELKKEETP